MKLNVSFNAVPFDEHYQMAFLYCVDKTNKYVFSLSRFPDSSNIEIMVSDQINYKVEDLTVRLCGNRMEVDLKPEVAKKLDNQTHYTILLEIENVDDTIRLHQTLLKIFEGKRGLSINPIFEQLTRKAD